jgi:pyruvate formate lyase activating enzyme
MLDWPGRVTTTVFLAGCPLRCPYCHNPELISESRATGSLDAVLEHIRLRRQWLDGVVITGGEPTADPALPQLIALFREQGLPVKLDTNGTNPELLKSLIAEKALDFVALDVKTSPERYDHVVGIPGVWPAVERSIASIISSGIDHEFRTTCYPLAVDRGDLVRLASRLKGGKRLVLQQFRAHRTLDAAAVSVRPYEPELLQRAAEACRTHLPTTVRGV